MSEPARQASPFRRGGSIARRLILGTELRRLREARGISAEDAGYAIRGSQSKISRMEAGRVGFKQRDVADLLALYGVVEETERERLLRMAREAAAPDWWQRYGDILPSWFWTYLGLEETAIQMRIYEAHCVPALLQTEPYARSLIRLGHPAASEEEIASRVDLRLRRQQVLEGSDALRLWVVMDEGVLHRTVGGPEVMRAQLEFLAAQPYNVAIQIVPLDAPVGAMAGGSFTILRFADPRLADVVYLEQVTSALYLERPDDVDRYAQLAEQLCLKAGPVSETPDLLSKLIDTRYR